MTPLEAPTIYHAGCMAEYQRHRDANEPVDQQRVVLAGFAALIDALKTNKHLNQQER